MLKLSKNHTTITFILFITLINIYIILNFLFHKIPIYIFWLHCVLRSFMQFVLKQVHTVPTENYSVHVFENCWRRYRFTINIKMRLGIDRRQCHISLVISHEVCMIWLHVPPWKDDFVWGVAVFLSNSYELKINVFVLFCRRILSLWFKRKSLEIFSR